ncbi:hypothetical protein C8R46DRAFT_1225778 [Mycena filopes]|nr:hypothetical protein C8R46DRAFT_1225778 [Mycena filopes]
MPPQTTAPQWLKCDYCHKYPKRGDDANRKDHPYCSIECADFALGRTQDNTNNQAPVIPDYNCDQCHAFSRMWDDQTHYPYCSKTCADIARAGTTAQQQACIYCGVRPKDGNEPYCGNACAWAASQSPAQTQAQPWTHAPPPFSPI